MPDSLLPHAPSLDEPLDMLHACHERIEAQLRTLERLIDYLPDHGVDDQVRSAIANVLRYFDQAAPNHHEDEERDLFPRLLANAPGDEAASVKSLIDTLLADHQTMAKALAVVRTNLIGLSTAQRPSIDAAAIRHLADCYRRHIAREESSLLPLAKRLLTAEDVVRLSLAMTERRTERSTSR